MENMNAGENYSKFSPNYSKVLMEKTFSAILEKKGYKLTGTIGNGSYAKVKCVFS